MNDKFDKYIPQFHVDVSIYPSLKLDIDVDNQCWK